jgi:methyl-accepting chemotaxis protein
MKFGNLKVGVRLALGFGIVVILLVIASSLSVARISGLHESIDLVIKNRYPKIVSIGELQNRVNDQARVLRNAIISVDPADVDKWLAKAEEDSKQANAIYEKLNETISSAKGKELLQVAEAKRAAYLDVKTELIKRIKAGNTEVTANYLFGDFQKPQLDYFDSVTKLATFQESLMSEDGENAAASANFAIQTTLGITAFAALFALILAFIITRSVTRPLNEAVQIATNVAAGDLTTRIEVSTSDETGKLLQALKAMQLNLEQMVANVRSSSQNVADASTEIAQGNNDLSVRTEQQASALEETAASMEELSSTVKQNADSARQANQLAASASSVATNSGEVVAQVVETMKGINESSRKISDIISVIDGIAFQTNILALNAAVEAARAGDQGRGFAVVASEVRSLAGRSAEAAKEIKRLINASVERVEQGTALVDKAGVTITETVTSIRRVTDIMGEISAASSEQATGVAQVGEAVSSMDQVTQQNAALVEEMAAAASSLRGQAQDLVQVVASFKLNDGDRMPRAVAHAPRQISAPKRMPGIAVAPKKAMATPKAPMLSKPAALAKALPVNDDAQWETF